MLFNPVVILLQGRIEFTKLFHSFYSNRSLGYDPRSLVQVSSYAHNIQMDKTSWTYSILAGMHIQH